MADEAKVEVSMPTGLSADEERRVKEVVEAVSVSFDLPPGAEIVARFPRAGGNVNLDDTGIFIRIKRKQ